MSRRYMWAAVLFVSRSFYVLLKKGTPGNDRTSEANLEGSCNFLVFGKPRYSEIAHCLSEASLSNF